MTFRRTLTSVAIALALTCASEAREAHADPSTAPAHGRTKKPVVTAHAKAKPAPKSSVKKPVKHPTTEATETAKPETSASAGHEVVEHESRIEFDERLVRGQTAAGAIFLFQRTPTDLKSIVEVPTSFREKTLELLAPRDNNP